VENSRKPRQNRFPDRVHVQFRQLCAIARTALMADYRMADAEWREAIKERLAQLQFAEPPADMVSRAMSATEAALRLTLGPRPTLEPTPSPAAEPSTENVWLRLSDLVKVLRHRSAPPPEATPPPPRAVLELDEFTVLNQFWSVAGRDRAKRLDMLKDYAELAIVRPADWDYASIRANAADPSLFADGCFVCADGSRPRIWHHILQVQHGGSNTARNKVALCGPCHSAIHPWLPPSHRLGRDFSSLAEIAAVFFGGRK